MPFFAQQRNGFVARLQRNLDYLRAFGHEEALLNMQPVAQLSLGHAAVRLKTGIVKRRDMNAIHRIHKTKEARQGPSCLFNYLLSVNNIDAVGQLLEVGTQIGTTDTIDTVT